MSGRPSERPDEILELLQSAVQDEYVVLRRLGRGGMGFVYLAREMALDRLVAIKVALRHPADSAETVERFRREARLAASLEHPHIVRVYAVGETDALSWFAMEYVEGASLDRLVREQGPLAPARVRQLLRELSDALAYAHARGVIHRDVKPANVLAHSDGRFLLSDFGIAIQAAEKTLTTTGRIIGTPAYMSPEQFQDAPLTAASDQYALGGVVHFAGSGRPPFPAEDIAALIRSHLLDDPPPIAWPAGVGDPLVDRIVRRMLAKTPHLRYAGLSTITGELATGRAPAPDRARAIPRAIGVAGLLALTAAGAMAVSRSGVGATIAPPSTTTVVRVPADTAAALRSSPSPGPIPRESGTRRTPPRAEVPIRVGDTVDATVRAPAEVAATPQQAYLRVGTRVAGSVLVVNDNSADARLLRDPVVIPVAPGPVALSIRADSCQPWDSVVRAGAGDTISIGYRNPRCRQ